ncbi:MAG: hypothetical protein WHS82_02535 [Candidatus Methanosuratincola sp.]
MIDGGHAEARDYDNEFNFNTFALHCPKAGGGGSDPSAPTSALAAIAAIILGLVLVVLVRSKHKKGKGFEFSQLFTGKSWLP